MKTSECRRKTLLKHFESESVLPEIHHLCCDNCARCCTCGLPDCKEYANYLIPASDGTSMCAVREREVLLHERKLVEDALIKYHKSLVMKLVGITANGDVRTLTDLQLILGFSEHQITQVLSNLGILFTLSDIYQVVEIWDKRHA